MGFNKIKTIGIVALSGSVERELIDKAKINLENKGFKVKLASNIYDKNRYLAGDDKTKLEELYKFFEDDEIDLILCARGGYGAIRLVNKIDYNILKSHPKPFCGFSDTTALLLMIYKNTGMVTLHGPMACSDFGDEFSEFSFESLKNALEGEELEFFGDKTFYKGKSVGIIWGGNLATVCSLCGLDFIPNEDFIFFAEDVNEPVYKIDRMFQQLINIEKFKNNCKGIVLGEFIGANNQVWLEEYFEELACRLEIPIVSGFKITHNLNKITVPIGRKAKLEGNCLNIFN